MIWLLRLRWAGRDWYLADSSCAPVLDGVEIPHLGTLEVDGFSEAIDMGGGIGGAMSADVSLDLLAAEDMADLFLRGLSIDGAEVELSLWEPSRTYGQRVKMLQGRLRTDSVPQPGEPMTATLTDELLAPAEDYPPSAAVAEVETWSTVPDESDGERYPFPIGTLGPYVRGDGTTGSAWASTVVIVDDTPGSEKGLVSGAEIGASTVTITETDLDVSDSFAVSIEQDALGRSVAVVDLSAKSGAWTLDGTVDLRVSDMDGGLKKAHGSGTIRGLGDAALHLLLQRYSTEGPARVDIGRWIAAMGWLNAWKVGFYLETGADPLDTIGELLCQMCPGLWIMPGPNGFRPVCLIDRDPATCMHLEIGRNCDYDDDTEQARIDLDPVTSCTAWYAFGMRKDAYRAKVVVDETKHPLAFAGSTRQAGAKEVNCASYDRATAALTASEWVRLYWTKPSYFTVQVEAVVALQLELGTKVRFTDAERGVAERPMYVQGRQTENPDVWAITLLGWW